MGVNDHDQADIVGDAAGTDCLGDDRDRLSHSNPDTVLAAYKDEFTLLGGGELGSIIIVVVEFENSLCDRREAAIHTVS
ncbi:hypothetical protein GCM10027167_22290 [Nocardia heshunensis]